MNFPDVSSGHWGRKEIEDAVNRGFFSGYPDGTFGPDSNLTRAEAAKVANKVYEAALGVVAEYQDEIQQIPVLPPLLEGEGKIVVSE